MTKIAVNRCYGGFGLSHEAELLYAQKSGFELFTYEQTKYKHREGIDEYKRVNNSDAMTSYTFKKDHGPSFSEWPKEDDDGYWYSHDLSRDDPVLIDVIEQLGDRASGRCAKLDITEVPNDVEWTIEEYDGQEWVAEEHRTW